MIFKLLHLLIENYHEIYLLMIVPNFIPYEGQHCETTATGTLLKQLSINLSEPMLFGLGEGLGFIYWNMKMMDFPFLGGRIKPDVLTQNIAKNLGLTLRVQETSSKQKAWATVKTLLDNRQVVGLKLDCYHLDYFSKPIHFAGHYVAMYGYDTSHAFLVDTKQQGCLVKTSLDSLALARAEKGAMASPNLCYTLEKNDKSYPIEQVLRTAIKKNAHEYLNPPITNIGYKGILKTSTELNKWFRASKNIEYEFTTAAMLMEKAGTGGALFRNLYRDFLKESYEILALPLLNDVHEEFVEIASLWTAVAELLDNVGKTQEEAYLDNAASLLVAISIKEFQAMTKLAIL